MKAITIRGIDPDLDSALKNAAKENGTSINQLILQTIRSGLGIEKEKKFSKRYDDLDKLFGRWTEKEFDGISAKVDRERRIDSEIWQ